MFIKESVTEHLLGTGTLPGPLTQNEIHALVLYFLVGEMNNRNKRNRYTK